MTDTTYLTQLRKTLTQRFSLDELKTLCFDLGIDFEELPAKTKSGIARELVEYCKHRHRIDDLVKKGRELRSDIDWPAPPAPPPSGKQGTHHPRRTFLQYIQDAAQRWSERVRWLWMAYLAWLAVSALGFVASLAEVFDLELCPRFTLFAALALLGGLALLVWSLLPETRYSYTSRDRVILLILTLLATGALVGMRIDRCATRTLPVAGATEQAPADTATPTVPAVTATRAATVTPHSERTDTPVPCAGDVPLSWQVYQVEPGDTLSILARRHGTTVEDIMSYNCLQGTGLQAGQRLYLPALPTPGPSVTATVTRVVAPRLPVAPGTPLPDFLVPITTENVDQVVQLARWGQGTLNAVATSPTQPLLAAATALGIYIYDTETLEPVRFIETGAWVRAIAFSPDGALLASGSDANKIQLWRASDGELVHTLEGHTDWVRDVAFSADGTLLASASDDRTVRLWRVSDGTPVRTLEGHSDLVWSVAIAPEGDLMASGSCAEKEEEWRCIRGELFLWQVSDGTFLGRLEGHTRNVNALAFVLFEDTALFEDSAPSEEAGRILLASGAGSQDAGDDTVRLWDVETRTLLHTLEGHTGWVMDVTFSPDGARLASASHDGTLRLWQTGDGALLRRLDGHMDPVRGVAFLPDSQTLASASWDGTLRLWDAGSGHVLHTWDGFVAWLRAVAFSDQILAAGGEGEIVRLYHLQDGTLDRELVEHTGNVNALAFIPGGDRLASTSSDDTIQVWRVDNGARLAALDYPDDVSGVALSPDGALLAAGSCATVETMDWTCTQGEVRLWHTADWTLAGTLERHSSTVNSVAFSPQGDRLATGSGSRGRNDDLVRLWELPGGRLVESWRGHTDYVNSVAWDPVDVWLASGSDDKTVRLWPLDGGTEPQILQGHSGGVNGVAFSPAGDLLASGANDDDAILWRVRDGAQMLLLQGHTGDVMSLAFSPDGTLLATVSDDGTVRLWGIPPSP
jgi:WD40 repeat protein/LysM repeat protein